MGKGPISEASKISTSEVSDVELESVNDSDWRCTVGFLMDANSLTMPYSKLIPEAIASGKRRVIYSISFLDIIKAIKQRPGCSPTTAKSTGGYSEVYKKLCSEALTYENEVNKFNIPSRILACLLKVKILQIKAEAIRRSEMLADLAKRKEEDDQLIFSRKSELNQFKDTKSNKNGKAKPKGPDEQHSAGGNCPPKRNTKLRKRGEEWLDIEYIEDSPEDGPDAYIVLSNFCDAKLTYELLRIGVPLECIIKLEHETFSDVETSSSDSITPPESVTSHEAGGRHRETMLSRNTSFKDTDMLLNRVSSLSRLSHTRAGELIAFWSELEELMYEPETRGLYKEVASLNLTIPESFHPPNGSEEELQLKDTLYDQVSWLMYDLHDIIKQHELFLKNLVLRNIPNTQNESSPLTTEVYSYMLDNVPNECCDVFIIVNCLMEQVIASVDYSELSAEEYLALLEEELATDIPDNNCVEEKLQSLCDNYAMVETPTLFNPAPFVLSFSDRMLKRNYHYFSKHLDLEHVAYNFLKSMPLLRLWDEYKNNEMEKYQEHIQLVGKYISSESIPYNLICCYIYAYLFYNMYCSDELRIKWDHLEKSTKVRCQSKVHRRDKYIPQTDEDWCAEIVNEIILSVKNEKKSNTKAFHTSAQSLRSDSNKLTFNAESTQGSRSLNKGLRQSASKGKVQQSNDSLKSQPTKLTFSAVTYQKNQANENSTESAIYLGKAQSWTRNKDQSKVSWKSKSSVAKMSSRHKVSLVQRTLSGLVSNRSLQKTKSFRENVLKIPEMTQEKLKYQVHSEFVKYRMIEEMNSVSFLQAIYNASEEFYDVEHVYLDATDNILLRFYNPRCKFGFTERSSENYLTTACGLKDFCDYVLGNEWTWFEEEQEEKIIDTTSLTSLMNLAPEISPYPFYIDADFIIPNSIKWKILYNDTIPQPYSESTVDKDQGAIRTKTDTGVGSHYSDLSSSSDVSHDDNNDRGNGPAPVYGYDVGFDLRALFTATHSLCNLADGFSVKVNVTEQLYFRKSVCLQVQLSEFTLTYNFQLWPKVQGPERGDSFFLQNSSGVRLFFKKNNDNEWNPEATDFLKDVRFDLQFSWENGLIITFPKDILTNAVEYVCQAYIVHHKVRSNIENERKRCYLRNGQILKFLSNDSMVLLCPDGRIFTFTIEKRPTKRIPSSTNITEKSSFNAIPDYHKKKRKSKIKTLSPDMESRPIVSPLIQDFGDETAQPAFHVKEYTVLLPNGSYIERKDGFEREEENKFLVRTTTDVGGGEVFVRRSDGTNILERADGSRVVAFPDGSRITAMMTVQDQEIFCEWRYAEIYKYAMSAVNLRVFGDRDSECDTILLLDEGYVSVLLTHIMEHPNYATITYKGRKLPIEVSSVGDIKVKVSRDNMYDIKLRDVDLSIKGNCINMSREDSSNATIELFTDCLFDYYGHELCWAKNEKGDSFVVKSDGSCLFVDKDDACPLNQGDGICLCGTAKVHHCPCSVPHKSNLQNFHHREQRCFVVNRKLSGMELIHEDEVNTHLKRVQSMRNGRVALLRPDLQSDLCYKVAMVPLVDNESDRWLVPSEMARITREEREEFTCLPSTYGTPPSWYHRFPVTVEEPTNVECYEPIVLEIRLFQEICPPETDVISSTWSALNTYYNTSLQLFEPPEKFPYRIVSSEQTLKVPSRIRSEWQRITSPAAARIYQLALFYTTTKEEPEAYRSWVRHKASWAVSKSCLDARLRKEKSNRKAFRENVFPPYFSSPEAETYFVGNKIKKSLQACLDNISIKKESEDLSTSPVSFPKLPEETSSNCGRNIQNSDYVYEC